MEEVHQDKVQEQVEVGEIVNFPFIKMRNIPRHKLIWCITKKR